LEVGEFIQFFTLPFCWYGHPPSILLGVKIRGNPEPKGLMLQSHPSMSWIPSSQGAYDVPIMKLATNVHNSKGSAMINSCHLYLNLLSIYDLLLYQKFTIHPSFPLGEYPPSQVPLLWPAYPKPTKTFWNYLHCYVNPYISTRCLQWSSSVTPKYKVEHFWHLKIMKLFQFKDGKW
jgi:hypothetical protein